MPRSSVAHGQYRNPLVTSGGGNVWHANRYLLQKDITRLKRGLKSSYAIEGVQPKILGSNYYNREVLNISAETWL